MTVLHRSLLLNSNARLPTSCKQKPSYIEASCSHGIGESGLRSPVVQVQKYCRGVTPQSKPVPRGLQKFQEL